MVLASFCLLKWKNCPLTLVDPRTDRWMDGRTDYLVLYKFAD